MSRALQSSGPGACSSGSDFGDPGAAGPAASALVPPETAARLAKLRRRVLNAANILVLIGVMPLPWVLVSGELGKHGRASDGVVARVAVFAVCAFFVMLGIAARKAPRAACCVGLAVHSAIVGLGLVAMVCRGHAPSLPLALALPGLFTVVLIVGLVAAVQLRSLSRAPASP